MQVSFLVNFEIMYLFLMGVRVQLGWSISVLRESDLQAVILIFSVSKSGAFQGYARMLGCPKSSGFGVEMF